MAALLARIQRLLRHYHLPCSEKLRPGAHEVMPLIESTVKFVREPDQNWSSERRHCWDMLRLWTQDAQVLIDHAGSPNTPMMELLFGIFDGLFFRNSLRGRVVFAWTHEAGSSPAWTDVEERPIRINIYSDFAQKLEGSSCGTAMDCVLGLLLHEMIHAFIRIYRCDGRCGELRCKGHDNKFWNHDFVRDVGVGGHGRAWQYLAVAIERRAIGLTGMRLTLNRAAAWCDEGDKTGVWPTAYDLNRCGLVSNR